MSKRVQRLDVRDGYDRWAESYDQTANPLVALDRRHTGKLLRPGRGERILGSSATRQPPILNSGDRPPCFDSGT